MRKHKILCETTPTFNVHIKKNDEYKFYDSQTMSNNQKYISLDRIQKGRLNKKPKRVDLKLKFYSSEVFNNRKSKH